MIYTCQGQLQTAWSIGTFDLLGTAAELGMLGGSERAIWFASLLVL